MLGNLWGCKFPLASSLLFSLAIFAPGCGDSGNASFQSESQADQSPTWRKQVLAPDTLIARVDDLEIFSDQVEALADSLGRINPAFTRIKLRREALISWLLPRLAVASDLVKARAQALKSARRERERLVAEDGSGSRHLEGGLEELGFELWHLISTLNVGDWSEPIEVSGRWLVMRVTRNDTRLDVTQENHAVDIVEFGYLPDNWSNQDLVEAQERALLTIVEPSFEEVIPRFVKLRMSGEKSDLKNGVRE